MVYPDVLELPVSTTPDSSSTWIIVISQCQVLTDALTQSPDEVLTQQTKLDVEVMIRVLVRTL